jgi:hypothetical protein
MPITVSKASDWSVNQFVKVPVGLVTCADLTPNSRLLLMFLFNQCGYKTVSAGTIDNLLGMHRATRCRCIAELRELGFIAGTDSHIIIKDPIPVLTKLDKARERYLSEVAIYVNRNVALELIEQTAVIEEPAEKRDYMKEATDAWNLYRPKDYQSIRRISAQLIKAVDIHMKDNQIKPHDYVEFFSSLKSGVEQSDFWANKNSNKTLQAITGIGNPTDKKRSNVYQLLNLGFGKPAEPTQEEERCDTVVYPAAFRPLISDYEGAQFAYNTAYRNRNITPDIEEYVIRTEKALLDVGLDPALFRLKYGMKTWPTDTPEPANPRELDWVFDDERGYAL